MALGFSTMKMVTSILAALNWIKLKVKVFSSTIAEIYTKEAGNKIKNTVLAKSSKWMAVASRAIMSEVVEWAKARRSSLTECFSGAIGLMT
jgi:hypothetical protein